MNAYKDAKYRFPSPLGEMGLSILYIVGLKLDLSVFPSPLGEMGLSIVSSPGPVVDSAHCTVSVPSRGNGVIDAKVGFIATTDCTTDGVRPLSGKWGYR